MVSGFIFENSTLNMNLFPEGKKNQCDLTNPTPFVSKKELEQKRG